MLSSGDATSLCKCPQSVHSIIMLLTALQAATLRQLQAGSLHPCHELYQLCGEYQHCGEMTVRCPVLSFHIPTQHQLDRQFSPALNQIEQSQILVALELTANLQAGHVRV